MQKVSGTTMVMLYKSCRVFHKETNKIEFTFSDFSVIFYEFSKFQPKPITISDSVLPTDPWNF
jgi:hypothetical protein